MKPLPDPWVGVSGWVTGSDDASVGELNPERLKKTRLPLLPPFPFFIFTLADPSCAEMQLAAFGAIFQTANIPSVHNSGKLSRVFFRPVDGATGPAAGAGLWRL